MSTVIESIQDWKLDVDAATATHYRERGWWRDTTALAEFQQAAKRHPHKAAVVGYRADETMPTTLTYGMMAALVDRFALALQALGVERGDVVTLQLPNCWQFPPLVFACMRAGAIPNPVPHIYRMNELSYMLAHAGSKVYISESAFKGFSYAAMATEIQRSTPTLKHVVTIGAIELADGTTDFDKFFLHEPRELRPGAADELDRIAPSPDDPAFLMFTSGTTGRPKAAVHSFNSMWSAGRAIAEGVEATADDVCFMASTVGHLTGFYWGTILPLSMGQKLVYQDVWSPADLLNMVAREGITWTLAATPFVTDLIGIQQQAPRPITSLRAFACGGAPIPPSTAIEAGKYLGLELISLWGMTEVGACCVHHIGSSIEKLADSDGIQVDFMDVRIVDDDYVPVATGTEGRLQVRGPSIIMGYYRQPENTRGAITPDGWFETGDLGRRTPDNGIRITGRSKDIIIRGGQNVPVVEVENCLITHPDVREVAVVAYPDPRLGEKGCAVIVAAGEITPTLADLTTHLLSCGIAKQFWPERIMIVADMPRTPASKIKKFVLRDLVTQLPTI